MTMRPVVEAPFDPWRRPPGQVYAPLSGRSAQGLSKS